jgi:hypothetical protein
MTFSNLFTVVAADVKAAVSSITAGLKWFGQEARLAIGWTDKSVPGAEQTLALLFQAADDAATALERHASSGLADLVSNAVSEAGSTVANLISASGLDLASKAVLSAADVATVTAAQSIAQNAISFATAKLLGETAQTAARVAQANSAAASSPAAPAQPPPHA